MSSPSEISDHITIALAQLNPVMGDIAGNAEKARSARAVAAAVGADLVVFSELYLSGYPPEDLVLKSAFLQEVREVVEKLAADTGDGGPALLIGLPWMEDNKPHNTVVLLDGGHITAIRHKVHLPNYGVFDELRVFTPGQMPGPINFRGLRLGVPICEDIWFEDVTECLVETGAEILVVPNGSPFDKDKHDTRITHAVARVVETGLPLIYVNQVGGQDELVFDGASFVLGSDRTVPVQLPAFVEQIAVTKWSRSDDGWSCAPLPIDAEVNGAQANYCACVLGLRDYVIKNSFPGVLIGLSGGIDSALTLAMSVDALGADQVRCVMLPSQYTSRDSLEDAAECATALGVRLDEIAISGIVSSYTSALDDLFGDIEPDATEENIQARSRGVILMAMSNKFGQLLVTTGNKSEMSVGYATLYGDMAGGFNPLKDLYKTEVYELSKLRNQLLPKGCLGPSGHIIPERIITKAPTAELREDQTDQDSLPPYDQLDDILHGLVEEEASLSDIIARGHKLEIVARIEHLLYIAEYKRRQAAPGVKISLRNFGRDRRYPITNRFRDKG
jgi:NAD+ synthase